MRADGKGVYPCAAPTHVEPQQIGGLERDGGALAVIRLRYDNTSGNNYYNNLLSL